MQQVFIQDSHIFRCQLIAHISVYRSTFLATLNTFLFMMLLLFSCLCVWFLINQDQAMIRMTYLMLRPHLPFFKLNGFWNCPIIWSSHSSVPGYLISATLISSLRSFVLSSNLIIGTFLMHYLVIRQLLWEHILRFKNNSL